MSFWSDFEAYLIQLGALNPAGQTVGQNAPGVTAAASAPGVGIVTEIAGIWDDLRDGKMWRSLGWILLGVILMLLAAASLMSGIRNPAQLATRRIP